MKNEYNKKQPDPKPLNPTPAPHLSKKDIENKAPKEGSFRACVSRIPVMAKSLRLQTPSEFSQSHCRWEEKPLAVSTSVSSCRFLLNVIIVLLSIVILNTTYLILTFFSAGKSK